MGEHSPVQTLEYAGAVVLVIGGIAMEVVTQQTEVGAIMWLGALGLVVVGNSQEKDE